MGDGLGMFQKCKINILAQGRRVWKFTSVAEELNTMKQQFQCPIYTQPRCFEDVAHDTAQ